jgi:peroxiredoxin
MKRKKGDTFPELKLETVLGESLVIPDPGYRYSHVQFRRFVGCPICNTHIGSLRKNADRIKKAGIQEVIFFHSRPEDIAEFQRGLPFELIGDPDKRYYKEFGVEQSVGYFLNLKAVWAAVKGMARGRFSLRMQNGPLGLPAEFLVASDGRVVAAKYGKHAYDQWSVEELLSLTSNGNVSACPID